MTVQRALNDRRSEFKQADEDIGKTQAQHRLQEQQAQTDLTKAGTSFNGRSSTPSHMNFSRDWSAIRKCSRSPTRRPGWARPSGS
jgi:hypothetical protein